MRSVSLSFSFTLILYHCHHRSWSACQNISWIFRNQHTHSSIVMRLFALSHLSIVWILSCLYLSSTLFQGRKIEIIHNCQTMNCEEKLRGFLPSIFYTNFKLYLCPSKIMPPFHQLSTISGSVRHQCSIVAHLHFDRFPLVFGCISGFWPCITHYRHSILTPTHSTIIFTNFASLVVVFVFLILGFTIDFSFVLLFWDFHWNECKCVCLFILKDYHHSQPPIDREIWCNVWWVHLRKCIDKI